MKTIWDAIENGDIGRVQELIANQPNYLNEDTPLGTVLHFASSKGKRDIVEFLLAQGMPINRRARLNQGTPIHWAIDDGHADVALFLISKGAILDTTFPQGNPLFATIHNDHPKLARLLLAHGINPHVTYRSITGKLKNALSYAEERDCTEIAALLREHGCTLPVETTPEVTFSPATDPNDAIIAALTAAYGPVDPLSLQEIIPVDPELHISIHVIRPSEDHRQWTLFTTGMSARPFLEGDEEFRHAELLMHLPETWSLPHVPTADPAAMWPLQWMRRLAYFPHQARCGLGGPYTIVSNDEPPLPLSEYTQQTCWLLLANADGWSPVTLSDGKSVVFYTIMPVFTEERDFEIKRGVHRLLERMARKGVGLVVEGERKNVCG